MEVILKIAAPIFAALVLLTNMITEAIKKVKDGVNAKKVALFTAIILSVITCLAGAFYLQFNIWYYFVAAIAAGVILGFIVAQVAETGYDSAYMEFIEILRTIIKAVLGAKEPSDICEETDEVVAKNKK